MNKSGFTLMEILAVLLVLAVIASLAFPGVRAARFEIKNSQAKTAAKKLLVAINGYRQASGGGQVTFPAGGFTGTFDTSCRAPLATGIPGAAAGEVSVLQLAPCGFLSPKDFQALHYRFFYGSTIPTEVADAITDKKGSIALMAIAKDAKAGPKFYNANGVVKYAIYIDDRNQIKEYEAD